MKDAIVTVERIKTIDKNDGSLLLTHLNSIFDTE